MKKLTLPFIICLFFITVNSNAAMTGEFRQVFLQSAYKGCYETQRAASVNQDYSNKSIQQYCKCTTTYLADLLNNQLAIEIIEGNVKLPMSLVEIASNYCVKNYSKF